MSEEIRKIDFIKNMAVFNDFCWSSSIRDEGNNVDEFKKINILYGRNYSGKTTLSRIVRFLEIGNISERYGNPEFQFSFGDGRKVNQNNFDIHDNVIRVFNEDFIKDNLSFIIDNEKSINSFAILGKNNTEIEKEIKICEDELGSEDGSSGLIGKLSAAKSEFERTNDDCNNKWSELEGKLRDKANRADSGIKHNKYFGDANYNVSKLRADIEIVRDNSYEKLDDDQVRYLSDLLKEEARKEIVESKLLDLQYLEIVSKSKELVEKKIQVSAPIQELMNDVALSAWVRDGREQHKGKREKCAFCGNVIPLGLWEKLDKHFNQESEGLRIDLNDVLVLIEQEQSRMPNLLTIKSSDFYSNFIPEVDRLHENFLNYCDLHIKNINFIKKQIEKRECDIFTPFLFDEPLSVVDNLESIRKDFEEIKNKSNDFTKSLTINQSRARLDLRLHEVKMFIINIKYEKEMDIFAELKKNNGMAKDVLDNIQKEVDIRREKINTLKAQLKDESKGADQVNSYLNNFFGHHFISLKAIERKSGDMASGYQFEITRNGVKAFHLSEGECSLIAFCYFMAKLDDVETRGYQPIIWIDDPISSLDANHIFFVYSLINAKIVTPEKYEDNGEIRNRDKFKQLFISTHNLDFLKYLKRLPGALNKNISRYFIITRSYQKSNISLMPKYLKNYVTEFNFLFHQIYKCSHEEVGCDGNHDCYYNFGNNARKFLEAFLYYRYPNAIENDNKLVRFFGDDVLASSLTDRINNEFSHLEGIFERSVSPIDVPEMKKTAEFILKKIEEKDPDQYSALLQSIGVNEDDH